MEEVEQTETEVVTDDGSLLYYTRNFQRQGMSATSMHWSSDSYPTTLSYGPAEEGQEVQIVEGDERDIQRKQLRSQRVKHGSGLGSDGQMIDQTLLSFGSNDPFNGIDPTTNGLWIMDVLHGREWLDEDHSHKRHSLTILVGHLLRPDNLKSYFLYLDFVEREILYDDDDGDKVDGTQRYQPAIDYSFRFMWCT
ncbi:unnamed protein product [Sphenostylis stenocarpa]|uniref:Uncharacterized protein n=1 Tax=Sphenostylis stenocarpa TaxID=92480 RepID=A0AA86S481_9FABA|nr:unnamed protein product [Sphenostylis stenocarpa]